METPRKTHLPNDIDVLKSIIWEQEALIETLMNRIAAQVEILARSAIRKTPAKASLTIAESLYAQPYV